MMRPLPRSGSVDVGEAQLRLVLADVAARIGEAIDGAADQDDLAFRLDELLSSGEADRHHAKVQQAKAAFAWVIEGVDIDAIESSLGPAVAAELRTSEKLQHELARVVGALHAPLRVPLIASYVSESAPLAYLATLPPELARLRLAYDRGYVAALALVGAENLPRWMPAELARISRIGLQSLLRFCASLPGTDVSEEIVPPSDRLDLAVLEARVKRYNEKIANELTASGPAAYVPDDRVRDDVDSE